MVYARCSMIFLLLPTATNWCSICVHSFTTTSSCPTKSGFRSNRSLYTSSKQPPSSSNGDFEDRGDVDYYEDDHSPRKRRPQRQAKSSFNFIPNEEYFYEDESTDAKLYEDELPIAPYNGENEKMTRYKPRNLIQENAYYEEEGDDDDDYFFDDDEDDEEARAELGGNFWSNPTGGMDKSRQKQRVSSSSQRRTRRRSDMSREQRGSTSEYGRQRRAIRAPLGSTTPQVPRPAKDLYDRLFWYGFDPEESDQVGDKTIFGGTKGKFNGLTFLEASESPLSTRNRRQLPPPRNSRSQNRRYNDDDDYDDDYDDDDYYDFNDEEGEDHSNENLWKDATAKAVTPPTDKTFPRKGRVSSDSSSRRRSRRRPTSYEDYDDYPRESEDSSSDWVSKQVSSWFSEADDEDEDENYSESRSSGRRGRERQRSENTGWLPPINNALDAFFGVNREDMKYKADWYNAQMGIGASSKSSSSPRQSRRSRRKARNDTRRRGYAYKYDDDDDDDSLVVDIESTTATTSGQEQSSTEPSINGSQAKESTPRGGGLSWEERALAVERVPPKDIKAWGPSGELPIDARTKAIMDALEDIQSAKQKLEIREKKEALAKEDITILKVDAELQRRRLEESKRQDRRALEELRQIERDLDEASRTLRRARSQSQIARDQLEELQERHWALLSFYDPEQAEEKVDEALNELQQLEPAARLDDSILNQQEKDQSVIAATESMQARNLESRSVQDDSAA